MFKLINIFFTKRKNCVDYIHILYFFVCVCILVLVTPKWETQPARWVVCRGDGEPTNFCIKLWILTRGFIWTLGLGKQSQHCQDSIGTLTQKTQLLLPTLHISLYKRKCKNWNFLQCDGRSPSFPSFVTRAALKPHLVVVHVRVLPCAPYAALSELLVGRVPCVLFLNIYFFNTLLTCQQKQKTNNKKRAVFEDC